MRIKPFNVLIIVVVLTFISIPTWSQISTRTYQKEWKKADSLIQRSLPKSALAQVKKIYQLAKKK